MTVDSRWWGIHWQQYRFVQASFQNAKSNRRTRGMLHNCWERKQHFKTMIVNCTEATKQCYFQEVPGTFRFEETCSNSNKIVWYKSFSFFFVGMVNVTLKHTHIYIKKIMWYYFPKVVIPNCERTSLLKEPFCSKVLEIKLIWRMYNSAKWASHRRIKHWRILLLMLWLKRYIKKNITETQVRT